MLRYRSGDGTGGEGRRRGVKREGEEKQNNNNNLM